MKKPLVSVSIPTFNSERFIDLCIESIKNQTYRNIEIIIVDGGSKDRTIEILNKRGIKNIFFDKYSLLSARHKGIIKSHGEYILLLDSDQILNKNSIEKAVTLISKGFDALALGENAYKSDNFLEKLFTLDRKLINAIRDMNPYTGVILPRMYRENVIKKAFKKIPKKVIERVGGQDHAIIYLEVWQISKNVCYLPNSVKHIEPSSLRIFIKKFYRWGYTSVNAHLGKYEKLLNKKERFRTGLFKRGYFSETIGSIILLVLKGIPFKIGYYVARLRMKKINE